MRKADTPGSSGNEKLTEIQCEYISKAKDILQKSGLGWRDDYDLGDFVSSMNWLKSTVFIQPYLNFSGIIKYKNNRNLTLRKIEDATVDFIKKSKRKWSDERSLIEVEAAMVEQELMPIYCQEMSLKERNAHLRPRFHHLMGMAETNSTAYNALRNVISSWVAEQTVPSSIANDAAEIIDGSWQPQKKPGNSNQKTSAITERDRHIVYIIETLIGEYRDIFRKSQSQSSKRVNVFAFVANSFNSAGITEITDYGVGRAYNKIGKREEKERIVAHFEFIKSLQMNMLERIQKLPDLE